MNEEDQEILKSKKSSPVKETVKEIPKDKVKISYNKESNAFPDDIQTGNHRKNYNNLKLNNTAKINENHAIKSVY